MNVDLKDLVNCSFCNAAIVVRILSPGDDGALSQLNTVASTTNVVVDALQQALAQQTIVAPAPPPAAVVVPVPAPLRLAAPAAPVAPPATLPALAPAVVNALPLAPVVVSAPQSALENAAAPEVAAPPTAEPDNDAAATDTTEPRPPPVDTAAPAPLPTLAAMPLSFTTDTAPLPTATAPVGAPHARAAERQLAASGADVLTPPTFAPATVPAPMAADGEASTAEVETVAAPADGGRRSPRRAPPPHRPPPADGPDLGSAAAGHGPDGPGFPVGLAALLFFLVPGFAHWLWANAELRPRASRSGRPERPG